MPRNVHRLASAASGRLTLLVALAAAALALPALGQEPTPPAAQPQDPVTAQPQDPVTAQPPATAEAASVPAEPGAEQPLRPWQRQEGPPDGKWLTDAQGRQYYVRKFARPAEGAYLRLEGNRVRLPGGVAFELVDEDAEFFYAKIYRVDNIETRLSRKKAEPTPEQLAAKEAEYRFEARESDRVRFVPFGEGLPNQGQWRNGFELADVNGDRKTDIAHGGTRRTMAPVPNLFIGDGKGAFRYWQEATYPRQPYDYGDVAVGDFNGDGKADLALAIHLRGLLALFGDGKGAFRLAGEGLSFEAGQLQPGNVTQFSSRAIVALDWDRDGDQEILALAEGPMGSFAAQKGLTNRMQQSYGVALYDFDTETGKWVVLGGGKTHPELFGDSLVAADFDGDGRIDFAAGSNSRSNKALVHLHHEDGSWGYLWVEPVRDRAFARAVGAGDFDGDGKADLAVGYQSVELGVWRSGIDVMLSRPEAAWERRTVYVEAGREGFYSLATGDLDGDGHADLTAGTGDGRVFAFLGDGKGGFSREATDDLAAEAGCRVYDLGITDLDGDRRGDLVAAFAGEQCPDGGRLSAWASRAPRR